MPASGTVLFWNAAELSSSRICIRSVRKEDFAHTLPVHGILVSVTTHCSQGLYRIPHFKVAYTEHTQYY